MYLYHTINYNIPGHLVMLGIGTISILPIRVQICNCATTIFSACMNPPMFRQFHLHRTRAENDKMYNVRVYYRLVPVIIITYLHYSLVPTKYL